MRALLTGGTNGIGCSVAQQLAGRGWKVILVGRNAEQGRLIASNIGGTL